MCINGGDLQFGLMLLAVGATSTGREIEMKVVAMRLVRLGAKHGREYSAGTAMRRTQECAGT